LQILTDVLARPVKASAERETSSRGAALLALEQLGAFDGKGLEAAHYEFDHTYQPNPTHHQRYLEAMERQRTLYKLLIKPRT
jgi:gluconokinase